MTLQRLKTRYFFIMRETTDLPTIGSCNRTFSSLQTSGAKSHSEATLSSYQTYYISKMMDRWIDQKYQVHRNQIYWIYQVYIQDVQFFTLFATLIAEKCLSFKREKSMQCSKITAKIKK